MESFAVLASAMKGPGLTIDGKPVVNATRIVVDASKPYVEVEVTVVPRDVDVTLEGFVELRCAHCHEPLEVIDRSEG